MGIERGVLALPDGSRAQGRDEKGESRVLAGVVKVVDLLVTAESGRTWSVPAWQRKELPLSDQVEVVILDRAFADRLGSVLGVAILSACRGIQ